MFKDLQLQKATELSYSNPNPSIQNTAMQDWHSKSIWLCDQLLHCLLAAADMTLSSHSICCVSAHEHYILRNLKPGFQH
jgi:hypothetical protein